MKAGALAGSASVPACSVALTTPGGLVNSCRAEPKRLTRRQVVAMQSGRRDAWAPSICARFGPEGLLKGRAGFTDNFNELFSAFADDVRLPITNDFQIDEIRTNTKCTRTCLDEISRGLE
jgi:hypothetical protein